MRLEPPQGGWQLVVVDNGSRERTAGMLREFRQRLPLAAVREPRPGLTLTLNAAIPVVTGDPVAILGDGMVPEPDWLLRHAAVPAAHPEFAVFGGRITPDAALSDRRRN